MNEPEGERQLTTSTSSLTLASNTSSVNDIDYTLETSDSPAIDDTVMEDVNVEKRKSDSVDHSFYGEKMIIKMKKSGALKIDRKHDG